MIYMGFMVYSKRHVFFFFVHKVNLTKQFILSIALKDVHINSLDDAKRLLLPTLRDQTLEHMRKAA